MSRLELTFSDIYTRVSDFLALGTSPTGDDLTKVKDIVYRAYRQFLYPIHPRTGKIYTWSFLKKHFVIQTQDNKWKIQLPVDFERMLDNPQYGDQEPYGTLEKVSTDIILRERSIQTFSSFPMKYALNPSSTDPELGTLWEMWLWPEPNGGYTIHFPYIIAPQKPTNDNDVILGGNQASETLMQMAFAVAELQEENVIGVHKQEADRLLNQMILADGQQASNFLGRLTTDSDILIRRGYVEYGTDDVYSADR